MPDDKDNKLSVSKLTAEIQAAWRNYDRRVRVRLQTVGASTKRKGAFRLIVNEAVELRAALDELEGSREFRNFIDAVRIAVMADGYHKGHTSFWERGIGNALRRSGYYAGHVNSKAALRGLLRAFEPHDVTITYLAPLEYVHLEMPSIDCRTFSISKFTAKELDNILKIDVSKLFYPWAVANTEFLCLYWFLVVMEKRRLKPLGKIDIDLGSIGKVTPQYSPYPALEKALHRLAMYDWVPDWARDEGEKEKKKGVDWKGWLGFKIPFVIRITDNILESPSRTPSLETLETQPYFDSFTNEEIGEQPSRYINLDEEQTRTLQRCLTTVDAMLSNMEPFWATWPFFMRGLGFLVKGFFAKGLEQLLWHITVLEALFGERRPGITAVLSQRVALVLGETEVERKEIRKFFMELYDLRSALVHGSELKDGIWEGHLKVARDLVRRSLLWFLSFAEVISKTAKRSSSATLPERKELMAVIDSRAANIIQLAKVLRSVPQSFPSVKKWQEPWVIGKN